MRDALDTAMSSNNDVRLTRWGYDPGYDYNSLGVLMGTVIILSESFLNLSIYTLYYRIDHCIAIEAFEMYRVLRLTTS